MDTIRELIAELGEIVPCEIPNYSLKTDPILTVGEFGKCQNELNARGIAFDDTTELIYLADCGNSRVRLVSLKGEFVKQFGNDKLRNPCGIAVTNECIYLTDTGHNALFQFRKKDFKLLNKTGTEGNEEGQLYWPQGLCIDTNGDVMVADTDNNRISVFSKQLKFKSCLGIGHLQYLKMLRYQMIVSWYWMMVPNVSISFLETDTSSAPVCHKDSHRTVQSISLTSSVWTQLTILSLATVTITP